MEFVTAESAYLFRHALLRSAAYELQLPGERAQLHALVARVAAAMWQDDEATLETFAWELCEHCRLALQDTDDSELATLEARLLGLATEHASRRGVIDTAVQALARLYEHPAVSQERRLESGVRCARLLNQAGRHREALALARRILAATSGGGIHGLQALALTANCHYGLADLNEAGRLCEDALAGARAAADSKVLVDQLALRGRMLADAGNYPAAVAVLNEARDAALQLGPSPLLVRVLGTMAGIEQLQSRLDEAEALYREAQEASENLGHISYIATTRGALALIARLRGNTREAEQGFLRAARELEDMGHLENHTKVQNYLANLYIDMGRLEESIAIFDEIIGRCYEYEWSAQAALYVGNRALALSHLGRVAEAIEGHRQAVQMSRKCRVAHTEVVNLNQLAATLFNSGDELGGENAYVECAAVCRATGNPGGLVDAMQNFGHVFMTTGRLGRALAAYQQAKEVGASHNNWHLRVSTDVGRAKLDLLAGVSPSLLHERLAGLQDLDVPVVVRLSSISMLRARADAADGLGTERLRLLLRAIEDSGLRDHRLADTRDACVRLIDALERTPAAPLFRGFLPDELDPRLRLALLDRMRELEPDAYAELVANTGLHAAMLAGTEGLTVPDWRDTTPP